MKQLGLSFLLGLALVALPGGAAHAANGIGWRGGGHYVAPAAPHVVPAPVVRSYAAPRYYNAPVYRGYNYPRYTSAHIGAPLYVPGYWGLHGITRVWVPGDWSYPPFAGWAWAPPHWAWNGYQWVWQEGTWAPPY